MKVIWRNNKSAEISPPKNVGCGSNCNGISKDKSLTVLKGYSHNHVGVGQDQQLLKDDPSEENGFIISRPERGDANKSVCRVCGRDDLLRSLESCDALLNSCFGVKVKDLTAKICKNCADLVLHTQKFKDMVCAAFQTPSEVGSVKDFESLLSISKPKNGATSDSEENFIRKITLKKKPSKPEKKSAKTLVYCTNCKQKYPMPGGLKNFLCSRCKIKSASDRTISCVKCRVIVPSTLMKEHLEMHTKAELKGRCRLRSLTKKPSEAQTTDCVPKKQHLLQCGRCFNRFESSQRLEEHMKVVHGEFWKFICNICGKDMMSSVYLDKHMKIHSTLKTFSCQVCGKIFKQADTLQRHAAVHSARSKQPPATTA